MHERHQEYTLYFRHVYILAFFHVFVYSLSLRCLTSSALCVGVKTLHNRELIYTQFYGRFHRCEVKTSLLK